MARADKTTPTCTLDKYTIAQYYRVTKNINLSFIY